MKTGSDRSGGNPWVNGKWAIARADGVHERWLGDVRRNKDERELFGGVRGSPVPNVEVSCQLIPVRVGCGAGTGRCVHGWPVRSPANPGPAAATRRSSAAAAASRPPDDY